jgi:hypothetical protein
VRVLQPDGEMDLAEKALGAEGGGELALERVAVAKPFAQRLDGRHAVPPASRSNRGLPRSALSSGSIRSHAADT